MVRVYHSNLDRVSSGMEGGLVFPSIHVVFHTLSLSLFSLFPFQFLFSYFFPPLGEGSLPYLPNWTIIIPERLLSMLIPCTHWNDIGVVAMNKHDCEWNAQ